MNTNGTNNIYDWKKTEKEDKKTENMNEVLQRQNSRLLNFLKHFPGFLLNPFKNKKKHKNSNISHETKD